ncbi:putative phosphatidyl ethanolamine-binding domain protein [Mycobacterium kansasii]|uniref:Putative phosphatidyl ethanolamine-binding domain protein n=1 Tax=Mycobacterium kansasii TaxID=1768 RepID=A0A1V3XF92_MYCKA|nr:putative phosphatidyl ethanolamine-binding domain protein [Mycobacterium kansasii]
MATAATAPPDAFVGAGPADGRHDEGGTRRGPLTISSPAFADGAPIPVQYTCKGANIAPPLSWSAPLGQRWLSMIRTRSGETTSTGS